MPCTDLMLVMFPFYFPEMNWKKRIIIIRERKKHNVHVHHTCMCFSCFMKYKHAQQILTLPASTKRPSIQRHMESWHMHICKHRWPQLAHCCSLLLRCNSVKLQSRMLPTFTTAHTFCASCGGLRKLGFLMAMPAKTVISLRGL